MQHIVTATLLRIWLRVRAKAHNSVRMPFGVPTAGPTVRCKACQDLRGFSRCGDIRCPAHQRHHAERLRCPAPWSRTNDTQSSPLVGHGPPRPPSIVQQLKRREDAGYSCTYPAAAFGRADSHDPQLPGRACACARRGFGDADVFLNGLMMRRSIAPTTADCGVRASRSHQLALTG
jgi:hypothetical protein